MEEKDYKKLYEDTVALAKDGLKDGLYLSQSAKAVTEFLFPQLKETEDEKVKRELTRFLINFNNGYYSKPSETQIDSWVKWVDKKCGQKTIECIKLDNEFENQISHLIASVLNGEHEYNEGFVKYASQSLLGFAKKEQKPVDKDEPKFKVGDWVVYNRDDYSREIIQVYDMRDGRYYFTDNIHFSWSVKECDEKSHLWTIQDAKDGDVLATEKGNPFIYDKNRYNNGLAYYYAGLDVNKELTLKSPHHMLAHFGELCSVFPATKEQRDLLFQKMKEAGYEWDAEKKELKKIEQNPVEDSCKNSDDITTEEKDRTEYKKGFECGKQRVLKYPEEFGLCKKTNEWGEKDEKMLNSIIEEIRPFGECPDYPTDEDREYYYGRTKMIDWLKSLKFRLKPSEVKNETKNKCPNYSEGYGCSTSPLKQCDTCPDYKLYNHWRPSKEQLKTLWNAIVYVEGCDSNFRGGHMLELLYNELKQL